jgi:predicted PurR-regulated permease PerM
MSYQGGYCKTSQVEYKLVHHGSRPMQTMSNQAVIIFLTAVFAYLLYLLAPMLTPFLLGALLAYLADPLVKRLDKCHVPHLLSVTSIFLVLFCAILLLILILFPLIQNQITTLITVIPQLIFWIQDTFAPWVHEYMNINTIKSALTASVSKSGWVLSAVLSSGYTVTTWLVNIVLTLVVTFYLLRDWDRVLAAVKNLLPTSKKAMIIKLAKECDEVLSAFFRGQLLVMLALCLIYSIGLFAVGLELGIIIGILGGLLSIVPYLGSTFVIVAASIAAVVQFGAWQPLSWVVLVFLIGQSVEGFVLTPYLIGERIGLHPVAVIFAILAGGSLFGFFGVLLALPAAAVIMVLLRFLHQRLIYTQ